MERDAQVVWLTGLSGAGKTTLARELARQLKDEGIPVELLDGDEVRKLNPKLGFSREERDAHVRMLGFLASVLERNGISVIVSVISPYRDSREAARALCRSFCEVHVATPLEACEKRDVKGLYRRARTGELRSFTGIDDPYEAPFTPEVIVDTSRLSVDEAVAEIRRWVPRG